MVGQRLDTILAQEHRVLEAIKKTTKIHQLLTKTQRAILMWRPPNIILSYFLYGKICTTLLNCLCKCKQGLVF